MKLGKKETQKYEFEKIINNALKSLRKTQF